MNSKCCLYNNIHAYKYIKEKNQRINSIYSCFSSSVRGIQPERFEWDPVNDRMNECKSNLIIEINLVCSS